MSLNFDVYISMVNEYIVLGWPPSNANGKKDTENNAKSMNAILCNLSELKFVKVMHCDTTSKIWEKFQKPYGNDKVKAKLQTHRRKFEKSQCRKRKTLLLIFCGWMQLLTQLRV